MARSGSLADAQRYVATSRTSGQLQLELLKLEGFVPQSHVLEVGCGCLSAGVPVMSYLNRRHYVGIEPNRWLLDAAMTDRRVLWLVATRRPAFLERTDFDAAGLGRTFDYVLSHSVLSHCAHWQLESSSATSHAFCVPKGEFSRRFGWQRERLWKPGYGGQVRFDGRGVAGPGRFVVTFNTVQRTAEKHGLNTQSS